MKKKSIIINEFHHKELSKLSEQFGSKLGLLVEQMILYFKKTGINPNDAKNENPSTNIKTLDKRIVSFLKVQERDILKPMRVEVYQYSKEQKTEISTLSNMIMNTLKQVDENNRIRNQKMITVLKEFSSQSDKQEKAIIEISKLIDEKNKSGIHGRLKSLFE